MFDFKNKIALVTGASGNLGEATVRAFHTAGAKVIAVSRKLDHLNEAFQNLDNIICAAADLTDETYVETMANEVLEKVGRVDILVNVAGGFTMGPTVHETDLKTWAFMFDLNATSAFLTARAFIPTMLENGTGKIINVASKSGLDGAAKQAPYSVSKAAVIRLTETLAAEYKSKGINANCILPGTIDTPENREAMPKAKFDKWVHPDKLASVILFLASEGASAIHGAAVPVYGLG